MPKRKITLDEAFAVFEQHGLQVEVKAVQTEIASTPLSEFLEPIVEQPKPVQQVNKKTVKITLFATHTMGSGGELTIDSNGNKHISDNGIVTYGPGIVNVPISLAQHLLHQDALAREADERMLEKTMRNYIVVPRQNKDGSVVNCAVGIVKDNNFDMSSFLGSIDENNMFRF